MRPSPGMTLLRGLLSKASLILEVLSRASLWNCLADAATVTNLAGLCGQESFAGSRSGRVPLWTTPLW